MYVLLVEDDDAHAELIRRTLERRSRVQVLRAPNAHRALALLDERPVQAVVLDYSLPDRDGLDVLRDIRSRDDRIPVIFLTAADSVDVCVSALRAGAADYIVKRKDFLEALAVRLAEVCPVTPTERPAAGFGAALVGESEAIVRLRTAIVRAAASAANVLIEGETGTGKELVAQAIHAGSTRAKGPFVAVNCAEIAESLFESELFGHVRGAFTGAVADRRGLLEHAAGGTLLLDEIEDLPRGAQVKFLRVLQNRQFKPVGSSRYLRFDARVIAASNRDLERLVEEGTFRRDLYFRLDVLRIRVPPLRERREDIPRLARHFVARYNARNGTRFGELSAAAVEALSKRDWPGNVRELENLIERTLVNSTGDTIDETALFARPKSDPFDERERLLDALQRNRWSREATAAELGISRVTLWRWMKRHRIDA
jgi:DNA-binding NtrC family response regulator